MAFELIVLLLLSAGQFFAFPGSIPARRFRKAYWSFLTACGIAGMLLVRELLDSSRAVSVSSGRLEEKLANFLAGSFYRFALFSLVVSCFCALLLLFSVRRRILSPRAFCGLLYAEMAVLFLISLAYEFFAAGPLFDLPHRIRAFGLSEILALHLFFLLGDRRSFAE